MTIMFPRGWNWGSLTRKTRCTFLPDGSSQWSEIPHRSNQKSHKLIISNPLYILLIRNPTLFCQMVHLPDQNYKNFQIRNPSSCRWEIPHLSHEKSPKLIKNPLLPDKKSHLFVNEIIWSSLYIYLFCKHTVVINCPDTKEIMQSNLLNHSLLYLCSLCQNCLPSSVAGVYTSSPSRRIQMSALAPQTKTQSTNKLHFEMARTQSQFPQNTFWVYGGEPV